MRGRYRRITSVKDGGWGLGTRPLEREGFRACGQITYNAETAEPAEKKCLRRCIKTPTAR